MLLSTTSQWRSYLVPHDKQGFLDLWEQLVIRRASTLLFLLGFTIVQCLRWFLSFALHGGELWVEFIFFCLSCSRVDSSEDVIHRHRVKGGKWPCSSQVISSSLLLPHELKNRGTKRSILNFCKGSTWQIYLEWQEIPCIGRYGGLSWQESLALGIGCTSEPYTQYEF